MTARRLALWTVLLGVQTLRISPPRNKVKVGDLLPRIDCPKEYEARVFAIDLKAPDGLAIDALGRILVVEEAAGRVTRIGEKGEHNLVVDGLRSPEGICMGEHGEFFVVEDCADGRLLHFTEDGTQTVLATGLDAPEGVLYVNSTLYFTESDAQLIPNKIAMRTRVSRMERGKGKNGEFGPVQLIIECRFPFSFTELTSNGMGNLLLLNETANALFPAGLINLNLASKTIRTYAAGLHGPEGLCKANPRGTTDFPLLIAEEQVAGSHGGRLSLIENANLDGTRDNKADESHRSVTKGGTPVTPALPGKRTTFATGFQTLEDVLVAPNRGIFITEDLSGMIIELRPKSSPTSK